MLFFSDVSPGDVSHDVSPRDVSPGEATPSPTDPNPFVESDLHGADLVYQWTDITSNFTEACAQLELGELLHDSTYVEPLMDHMLGCQ